MDITTISPRILNMYDSILADEIVRRHLEEVKNYHQDSYEHLVRVGKICMFLGARNYLCDNQLQLLGYAGALHDVGKREIPDTVLGKAGPLNDDEREIMKSHVRFGFEALNDLPPDVRAIIGGHHEYQIASYPRKGSDRRSRMRRTRVVDVPVNSRAIEDRRNENLERRQTNATNLNLGQMVAAADFYDALSCKREYKEAMPLDKVREIMEREYLGPRKYVMQLFS